VKSEQLLTQSKVFEDEIGAGAKSSHQPAENVSKQHNHGTKILPDDPSRAFREAIHSASV
jgi:hypothetical protein